MQTMKFTPRTIELRAIVKNAPSFAAAIDRLKEQGLSRGRAILLARKFDGAGFNSWMLARQKSDDGRAFQYL